MPQRTRGRRRRRATTEAEFNLEHIRKIKRLARRVVRELEDIERWLLKWRKADRNRIPNDDEREAIERLYEPHVATEKGVPE